MVVVDIECLLHVVTLSELSLVCPIVMEKFRSNDKYFHIDQYIRENGATVCIDLNEWWNTLPGKEKKEIISTFHREYRQRQKDCEYSADQLFEYCYDIKD